MILSLSLWVCVCERERNLVLTQLWRLTRGLSHRLVLGTHKHRNTSIAIFNDPLAYSHLRRTRPSGSWVSLFLRKIPFPLTMSPKCKIPIFMGYLSYTYIHIYLHNVHYATYRQDLNATYSPQVHSIVYPHHAAYYWELALHYYVRVYLWLNSTAGLFRPTIF